MRSHRLSKWRYIAGHRPMVVCDGWWRDIGLRRFFEPRGTGRSVVPRLINCSSYTKSNSPWIPTDAITALVVKELDYLDQSGARVATDWVAAVGGRTYAGNPAGVGLWHVNYANGVDYQDQTSMPDDTGLGINQPISVEAALALDPNGFPEIQVLVGSRFERESGYQPLTILTKPTDDATSPLFLRAEPIPTPWDTIDNLWVPLWRCEVHQAQSQFWKSGKLLYRD